MGKLIKLEEKRAEKEREEKQSNIYAFTARDEELLKNGVEIVCPKCGESTQKKKCPECGIPLRHVVSLKTELFFGKQMVKEAKVCPRCGNPTDGDVCEICEKNLFLM